MEKSTRKQRIYYSLKNYKVDYICWGMVTFFVSITSTTENIPQIARTNLEVMHSENGTVDPNDPESLLAMIIIVWTILFVGSILLKKILKIIANFIIGYSTKPSIIIDDLAFAVCGRQTKYAKARKEKQKIKTEKLNGFSWREIKDKRERLKQIDKTYKYNLLNQILFSIYALIAFSLISSMLGKIIGLVIRCIT